MADKTFKITALLDLNTKDAQETVRKFGKATADELRRLQDMQGADMFGNILSFLNEIQSHIEALKKENFNLYTSLYGENGNLITTALSDAFKPLVDVPERISLLASDLNGKVSKMASMESLDGNLGYIRQLQKEIGHLYSTVGKESPLKNLAIDKNSNLKELTLQFQNALNEVQIPWEKMLSTTGQGFPSLTDIFDSAKVGAVAFEHEVDVIKEKIKNLLVAWNEAPNKATSATKKKDLINELTLYYGGNQVRANKQMENIFGYVAPTRFAKGEVTETEIEDYSSKLAKSIVSFAPKSAEYAKRQQEEIQQQLRENIQLAESAKTQAKETAELQKKASQAQEEAYDQLEQVKLNEKEIKQLDKKTSSVRNKTQTVQNDTESAARSILADLGISEDGISDVVEQAKTEATKQIKSKAKPIPVPKLKDNNQQTISDSSIDEKVLEIKTATTELQSALNIADTALQNATSNQIEQFEKIKTLIQEITTLAKEMYSYIDDSQNKIESKQPDTTKTEQAKDLAEYSIDNGSYALESTLQNVQSILESINSLLSQGNFNKDLSTQFDQLTQSLSDMIKINKDATNKQNGNIASVARFSTEEGRTELEHLAKQDITNSISGATNIKVEEVQSLANGIVKVTASLQNASGEWQEYSAKINQNNEIVDRQISSSTSLTKAKVKESENIAKATQQEIKANKDLEELEKRKAKVRATMESNTGLMRDAGYKQRLAALEGVQSEADLKKFESELTKYIDTQSTTKKSNSSKKKLATEKTKQEAKKADQEKEKTQKVIEQQKLEEIKQANREKNAQDKENKKQKKQQEAKTKQISDEKNDVANEPTVRKIKELSKSADNLMKTVSVDKTMQDDAKKVNDITDAYDKLVRKITELQQRAKNHEIIPKTDIDEIATLESNFKELVETRKKLFDTREKDVENKNTENLKKIKDIQPYAEKQYSKLKINPNVEQTDNELKEIISQYKTLSDQIEAVKKKASNGELVSDDEINKIIKASEEFDKLIDNRQKNIEQNKEQVDIANKPKIKDIDEIEKYAEKQYNQLKIDPNIAQSDNVLKSIISEYNDLSKKIEAVTQKAKKGELIDDSEIKEIREASRYYNELAEARAKANTSARKNDAEISNLQSKIDKAYADANVKYEKSTTVATKRDEIKIAYNEAVSAKSALNQALQATNDPTAQAKIPQLKKGYDEAIASVQKYLKELQAIVKESEKLEKSGNVFNQLNPEDMGDAEARANALYQQFDRLNLSRDAIIGLNEDCTKLDYTIRNSDGSISQMTLGFNAARTAIVQTETSVQKVTNVFNQLFDAVKTKAKFFFSGMGLHYVWTEMKKGVGYVKELDSAMTELRKVSDGTAQEYNTLLNNLSSASPQLAKTPTELVNSAADWARLGESLKDSELLAKNTAVLMNVSEFTDISEATGTLTSAMKAYGYEAKDTMQIIDKFNATGNNFAISTAEVADSLTRSGAALKAAGTDLDKSLAITAAANTYVQDPASVGNALKTLSMRIRGTKVELEEAGEDTEGMAESTSKLREQVLALTSVNGKKGFDILDDKGAYKDTYDILLGIGKVWKEMNDLDQAALLELVAGKRQGSIVSGIFNDTDLLEKAYDTIKNSAGSAMAENEKYLDSVQGKLDIFKASIETLWTTNLDSGIVKMFLNIANAAAGAAQRIDLMAVAIGSLVTFANYKSNFSWFDKMFGKKGQQGRTGGLVNTLLGEKKYDSKGNYTGRGENGFVKLKNKIQDKIPFKKEQSVEIPVDVQIKEAQQNIEHLQKRLHEISNSNYPIDIKTGAMAKTQAELDAATAKLHQLEQAAREADAAVEQVGTEGGLGGFGMLSEKMRTINTKKFKPVDFKTNEADLNKIFDEFNALGTNKDKSEWFKRNIDSIGAKKYGNELLWYLNQVENGKASLGDMGEALAKNAQQMQQTSIAAKAAGMAQQAFNMAMNVGISMAVSAAISFLTDLAQAEQKAAENAKQAADEYKNAMDVYNDNAKTISDIGPDFERLSQGVDQYGNNISLSADEFDRYHEITSQIAEMFPNMVNGFDSEGNAIIALTDKTLSATEALEKYNKEQKAAAAGALFEADEDVVSTFKNNINASRYRQDASWGLVSRLLNGEKTVEELTQDELEGAVRVLREGNYTKTSVITGSNAEGQENLNLKYKNAVSTALVEHRTDIQSQVASAYARLNEYTNNVLDTISARVEQYEEFQTLDKEGQQFALNYIKSIDRNVLASELSNQSNTVELSEKLFDGIRTLASNSEFLSAYQESFEIVSDRDMNKSVNEWFTEQEDIKKKLHNIASASDIDTREGSPFDQILTSLFSLDDSRFKQNYNALIGKSEQYLNDGVSDIKDAQADVWMRYQSELKAFNEFGIDRNKTQFGNIDLNNRGVLVWNQDNLNKYKDILTEQNAGLDWAQIQQNMRGTISTVLGTAQTFDMGDTKLDIAFSPMLQTPNGPEYLDDKTVQTYLSSILEKASADGDWSSEEIFKLDADGMEINGKKIQGLIADIGDSALDTAKAMHYLGKDGSLNLLFNQYKEFSRRLEDQNKINANDIFQDWTLKEVEVGANLNLAATGADMKDWRHIVQTHMNANNISIFEAAQTYEDLSEAVQKYNDAMSVAESLTIDNVKLNDDQLESLNAVLGDLSNYKEVVAEGSDNVVKNVEALKDAIKQKKADQAATIKLSRAQAQLKYGKLARELGLLVTQEGALDKKSYDRIDELLNELRAVENTVQQYQLLEAALIDTGNAYAKFQKAQELDEATDYGSQFTEMYSALNEGFKNGKIGTQAFQAAAEALVPTEIMSKEGTDRLDAIYNYINNTLSRYAKLGDDGISIDVDGMNNLVRDMIAVDGLLKEGSTIDNWEFAKGTDFDKVAKGLGLTKTALFDLLDAYADYNVDWDNPLLELANNSKDLDAQMYTANKNLVDSYEKLANARKNATSGEDIIKVRAEVDEAERQVQAVADKIAQTVHDKKEIEFKIREVYEKTNDPNFEQYVRLRVDGLTDTEITTKYGFEVTDQFRSSYNEIVDLNNQLTELGEVDEVTITVALQAKQRELEQIDAKLKYYSREDVEVPVGVDLAKLEEDRNKLEAEIQQIEAESGITLDTDDNLSDVLESVAKSADSMKGSFANVERTLNNLYLVLCQIAGITPDPGSVLNLAAGLSSSSNSILSTFGSLAEKVSGSVSGTAPKTTSTSTASPAKSISTPTPKPSVASIPTPAVPNLTPKGGTVSFFADVDTKNAEKKVENLHNKAEETSVANVDANTSSGISKISSFESFVNNATAPRATTLTANTGAATSNVSTFASYWNNLSSKAITLTETTYRTTINTVKNVVSNFFKAFNGTAHAQGTAFAGGSAYANGTRKRKGDWGVEQDQTALVGEIGPEIRVRGSEWDMLGENGAEFAQLKAGDIVFNSKQTEELLKHGYINSRARVVGGMAHAYGTAFANGTYTAPSSGGGSSGGGSSGGGGGSSGGGSGVSDVLDSFSKWLEKWFDWVEIKLSKQADKIDKYTTAATRAIEAESFSSASTNTKNAITAVTTQIANEKSAATKYTDQANKVINQAVSQGLISTAGRDSIKSRVANGTLEITDYNEKVRAAIEAYKEWADKAYDATNAVAELEQQQKELWNQYYHIPLDQAVASINKYSDSISSLEAKLSAVAGDSQNYFEVLVANAKKISQTEYDAALALQKKYNNSTYEYQNALLDSLIAQNKKIMDADQTALNTAKKNLATAKASTAADASIQVAAAQKALNEQIEIAAQSEANYTKALQENTKAKFDNISKSYETKLSSINAEINKLQANATYMTATGESTVSKKDGTGTSQEDQYNNLIDQYQKQIAIYEEQKNKLQSYLNSNKGNMALEDIVSAQNSITQIEESRLNALASLRDTQYDKQYMAVKKLELEMETLKDVADKVNASMDIASERGLTATEANYKSLITNGQQQILNLQQQNDQLIALRKTFEEYSDKWNELTEKINSNTNTIDSLTKSQIEWNNAIDNLPIERLDKALSVYSTMASYYESVAGLITQLGHDLTAKDYTNQIDEIKKKLSATKQEAEIYRQYMQDAALAVDGVAHGKSLDDWKNTYYDTLSTINSLQSSIDKMQDDLRDGILWRSFQRAHENAKSLLDVIDKIGSLIDDTALFNNDDAITNFGYLKTDALVASMKTAKQEVINYANDIGLLNDLYREGKYSELEYISKLKELQSGYLDAASSVKNYMDSLIDLARKQAEAELKGLDKVIDLRKEALEKKKEYYTYSKNLRNQTDEVKSLEAQLAALEGINSAYTKYQRAKLQEQLKDANDSLNDQLQEHSFELSSQALDDLSKSVHDAFDDFWNDHLWSNLENITDILESAEETTKQSSAQISTAMKDLLQFFNLNPDYLTPQQLSVNKTYASGTKSVPKNMIALTNENGKREMLVTKYGILTPLERRDGVIPNDLTERLYDIAANGIESKVVAPVINMPDVLSGGETIINQHFDNLINIEGNADMGTVAELKKMMPEILKQSYEYTNKKMYSGYIKAGGKRRI